MNGVSEFVVVKQTEHKTVQTLRRYIRRGQIFIQNAASGLRHLAAYKNMAA